MNRRILQFTLLASFLAFYSCQDIVECVINRHPVLPDVALDPGREDHFYSDHFRAQIKNEPLDNSYEYFFHFSDNLPPGLDIYVDHRTVIIEGVPEESGSFFIEVFLRVRQYDYYYDDCESQFNDCDGLCDESTSKIYHLRIL